MLDDLAGDDDSNRRGAGQVGVDELGIVAELHDVGDSDMADLRQAGDMAVVEASTGAEDKDLEIVPPEDVDRHIGHVELAACARRPDAGGIGKLLECS